MTTFSEPFIWENEVRDYEVDALGIVNNAHYFHYFDHCRVKHFQATGHDWFELHQRGFDIVLSHVDMQFKSPLRGHDRFYIESRYCFEGRLKLVFHQALYRQPGNQLAVKSVNTLVCVNTETQRPVRFSSCFESLSSEGL